MTNPLITRMDVDELPTMMRAKRHFVLYALRRASVLIALRSLLNSGKVDNFYCVNVNVWSARWRSMTLHEASAPS